MFPIHQNLHQSWQSNNWPSNILQLYITLCQVYFLTILYDFPYLISTQPCFIIVGGAQRPWYALPEGICGAACDNLFIGKTAVIFIKCPSRPTYLDDLKQLDPNFITPEYFTLKIKEAGVILPLLFLLFFISICFQQD